jgi:hypothetical protein
MTRKFRKIKLDSNESPSATTGNDGGIQEKPEGVKDDHNST